MESSFPKRKVFLSLSGNLSDLYGVDASFLTAVVKQNKAPPWLYICF